MADLNVSKSSVAMDIEYVGRTDETIPYDSASPMISRIQSFALAIVKWSITVCSFGSLDLSCFKIDPF